MESRKWGLSLHIDLFDCDNLFIRSRTRIKFYVINLCELIQMKAYGHPIIEWFGVDKKVCGYSLMQLIETSSITGHFVDENNSAYIDIFSCKDFDINKAVEFSVDFFKANDKKTIFTKIERGKEEE